jgi:hypothetical protein
VADSFKDEGATVITDRLQSILPKTMKRTDAQLVQLLDAMVIAAGTACAEKHTKHYGECRHLLERRAMYDPRLEHKEDKINPALEDHKLHRKNAAYMGVEAADYKETMWAEYNRFSDDLDRKYGPSTDARRRALKPAQFWRANMTEYPALFRVGLWYASVPTSSVSAERAFGCLREVGDDRRRYRLKDESVRAEVFNRSNKWLVDAAFADCVKKIPSLLGAPVSLVSDEEDEGYQGAHLGGGSAGAGSAGS